MNFETVVTIEGVTKEREGTHYRVACVDENNGVRLTKGQEARTLYMRVPASMVGLLQLGGRCSVEGRLVLIREAAVSREGKDYWKYGEVVEAMKVTPSKV